MARRPHADRRRDWALCVRRFTLDAILVRRARAAGVVRALAADPALARDFRDVYSRTRTPSEVMARLPAGRAALAAAA